MYAQVGLQVFYVVECLYGWWKWTRRDKSTGRKLVRIDKTKAQTALFLMVAGVIGIAVIYPLFRYTQDPAPFWDSLITVASFLAEYMLCIKLCEAWGVYFAADLISLVVLATLGDWVTFGTYGVFTILCIMGILAWRKSVKTSTPALSLASSIP